METQEPLLMDKDMAATFHLELLSGSRVMVDMN